MRPKLIAFLASSLWPLFLTAPARAEDCPTGDWFCEPALERPAGVTPAPRKEPDPPNEPLPEPPVRPKFATEPPPPPSPPWRRPARREWAFDVHLLAALIGARGADPDAGMGGVGFGLRFRPVPHLAIDGQLQLAFGNDYNGDERRETGFLLNAVGFLSPRSRIQPFILAGLHLSRAQVARGFRHQGLPIATIDQHYSYFGMQFGAGIEGRITRRTALHFDILAFVRGRTDDDELSGPEFVDPDTRDTTNTSGGVLLRGGALFYW